MELTFQTNTLSWLRCVLREVRRQEELAETVVPDTYPDIGSIIDAHADAVLRGKDLRSGSVTVSGGIKGGIFYQPEDASRPRCLELYIPFTVKLESPDLTERSQVLCDVRVTAVDGRMINSRKALLRVNLACSVTAYEETEQTTYTLNGSPAQLRVRQTEYDLELPLETAEQSFVISDSLELSEVMEQLCKLRCRLEVTDRKLVGARAVFRGNARCRLLYLSDGHELCQQEFLLPFSQFCDLRSDYDGDEQVILLPVVTGYDLEPDAQSAARKCYLNLHVLAQCTVYGKRQMALAEDAFTTQGMLAPVWEEFDMEPILDRPQTKQTVRQVVPGEMRQVVDTEVYTDYPSITRDGSAAVISAPVSVHVLGYDREGQLCGSAGKGSGTWELPVSEQAACTAWAEDVGSPFVSSASEGLEVRTELSLEVLCTAEQPMRALCGGTLETEVGRGRNGPSVILRRAARGAVLWDIAKAACANEETLRVVNGLEGVTVPDDRVLLIPVG